MVMLNFRSPGLRIGDIGIARALEEIMPHVREAGQLALKLQPRIKEVAAPKQKRTGSPFADALTAVDVLVEDRIGTAVLQLFADVGFFGEEHAADQISRFFPKGAPFIATLDPVNGTRWYQDGLPHFEIILMICNRAYEVLGTIIYLPATDVAYVSYVDMFTTRRCQHVIFDDTPGRPLRTIGCDYVLPKTAPKLLYLDAAYAPHEGIARAAGYDVVYPWRDYAGQKDWAYASHGVLTGLCLGIMNPRASLIDSGAFAFAVDCAGGRSHSADLDRETKRYAYMLSAANLEASNVMGEILAAYQDAQRDPPLT